MIKHLFIFAVLLIFISCSSDSISKKDIIEDEKFYEILKDFHKSGGIITVARLNDKKHKNDTISPYNYILKKHNISREDFDKTISYYSIHAQEFLPFYDSINNYFLSQKKELEVLMEEQLSKMSPKEQFASKNLWQKKQEWILRGVPKDNPFKFKVNTNFQGEYIVSFSVFTSPSLPSVEKRIILTVNYKDGTSEIAKTITKTKLKKYKKIKVSIKTNKNKKVESISGFIISSVKDEKIHFHLKDIEIKFINTNKKLKKKKNFIK